VSTVRSDGSRSERPILEVHNAWKAFGHVVALRDASLAAHAGEVLAVVGDNGAGKSTMIKVIAGVHPMDTGELLVDDRPVTLAGPAHARALGISTVFQDLALVESLDIAANMYLGRLPRRWGIFVDRRKMIDGAADVLHELRIQFPSVRVPVGTLSGGQRQGVAVARAVLQQGRVVLMDEPTAALGVRETRHVVQIIQELRGRGKAVILISHDLELVFGIADRIQVLRLGQVQGVRRIDDTDRREIVGMITGAIGADPVRIEEAVPAQGTIVLPSDRQEGT
jgi:ABC-type sugar transport system ATPase subunit